MIDFKIKIPFEIPRKKRAPLRFSMSLKRKVAQEWNELSRRQLNKVLSVFYSEVPDEHSLKIRLVKILFRFNFRQMAMLQREHRLIDLYPYINFILESNTLTQLRSDKIRMAWWYKTLYAPRGDFRTLGAEEWTDADTAYINFSTTRDEAHLDQLIAILWRPRDSKKSSSNEDWKNDFRVSYNQVKSTQRAKRMRYVSRLTKLTILHWYMGCRMEWENIFDRVFSGGTKESVESFGWVETIQKVSGKAFGTLKETQQTRMWEVLLHMESELKDQEYIESKQKRNAH